MVVIVHYQGLGIRLVHFTNDKQMALQMQRSTVKPVLSGH